jgi:hypothetical protein
MANRRCTFPVEPKIEIQMAIMVNALAKRSGNYFVACEQCSDQYPLEAENGLHVFKHLPRLAV